MDKYETLVSKLDEVLANQRLLLSVFRISDPTSAHSGGLGFQESEAPHYVYVGNSGTAPWYFVEDSRQVPIENDSLVGYIQGIKVSTVDNTTHGDSRKLHLTIRGDRTYVLVSGITTQFSRCVLGQLGETFGADEVARLIRLSVRTGEKKTVFASLSFVDTGVKFPNRRAEGEEAALVALVEAASQRLTQAAE